MGYSILWRIQLEWSWHRIMDAELKQALATLETNISRHVDERLDSFSRHFEDRLEAISRHVDERFESISRHFEERLENTETKLLTAFHNWAQTYESRARGTITLVHQFEERLGFVEERLNKLERARNGQTNPGEPKS
jgi:DNA anti-recombination protein RmuC